MVVPANTDFSRALQKPLDLIQSLFDQQQEPAEQEFAAHVAEHFQSIFSSRDQLVKIPSLASALSRQNAAVAAEDQEQEGQPQLVRWRCMIQDTNLGTEMFYRSLPSSSSAPSTSSSPATRRSGYFGAADLPTAGSADDGQAGPGPEEDNYANLTERTSMFAVSLPGETSWHAEAWGDKASGAEASASVGKAAHRLPLPEEASALGALLKIYDAKLAEQMGVTDVFEVVGVLTYAQLPQSDWQASGSGSGGAGPSSSSSPLLPCLHVIFSLATSLATLPPTLAPNASATPELDVGSSEQLQQDRAALIEHLAHSALHGDKLVAELVLLALVARVHATRGGVPIGAMSLNICSLPSDSTTTATQTEEGPSDWLRALLPILRKLSPAVVSQSLALAELNDPSKRLFPTSDGENLTAGRLQLARGTVLLLDEAAMGEGELKDLGVRNVRALNSVMTNRKLPYAFPYSEFEFESDLNVIIVSQGRSFLTSDVRVPLIAASSSAHAGDAPAHEPSASQWKRWRRLLLQGRAANLDVSAAIAEQIQHEFVAQRKAAAATTVGGGSAAAAAFGQEHLLRRMGMARLHALSQGKTSLDEESWSRTVALDEECMKRLQAMPARKEA